MGIEFNNMQIILFRTSMYYLWKERYPKDNRIKLKMDIVRIILELSFIVWFFKNKRERIASSQLL